MVMIIQTTLVVPDAIAEATSLQELHARALEEHVARLRSSDQVEPKGEATVDDYRGVEFHWNVLGLGF